MAERMSVSRTKLAVRAVVAGYRSVIHAAKRIGGTRGDEMTSSARSRSREILDDIDQHGTNADEDKRAARREIDLP